jgi:hypothetical protein
MFVGLLVCQFCLHRQLSLFSLALRKHSPDIHNIYVYKPTVYIWLEKLAVLSNLLLHYSVDVDMQPCYNPIRPLHLKFDDDLTYSL